MSSLRELMPNGVVSIQLRESLPLLLDRRDRTSLSARVTLNRDATTE